MPDSYIVTYTRNAADDAPAEIERLLQSTGAVVTHDPANRRFLAELNGDENVDVGGVRYRLTPVSDELVAVSPYRPDKLQGVSGKWNLAFTNLMRQTQSSAWGNWDLNSDIRAGAVGILDPETGSFTPVTTLEEANISEAVAYQSWDIGNTSAAFTESEVTFEGGYFDPSTETEVTVGLEAAWSFGSANSMVSRATISGRRWVDDYGVLLDKNHYWGWLLDKAKSVGYANDDGIVQGFGMITATTMCIGALNIGSIEDNSSFSIVGSVAGVTALTGGGKASAGVKGSFKSKKESKAFNSHTWPVASNSVEPGRGAVAILYQFTTFDGTTIIPNWARRIGNFAITFDNQHGGTYVGRCHVKYSVPGQRDRVERVTTVSGGLTDTIAGIPVSAHDLEIHVDFASGGDSYFNIASPISQWPNGTCTVDLSGVWPWGSKAEIRST